MGIRGASVDVKGLSEKDSGLLLDNSGSAENRLISVVVILNDDLRKLEESMSSLLSQTFSNFSVDFVFFGNKAESLNVIQKTIDALSLNACLIKADESGGLYAALNKAIENSPGKYITILSPGDVFQPTRLEYFVHSAEVRGASVMITYAEILDYDGKAIGADNEFFKLYSHGLLSNIAAHPCLSFTVLWHDLIVSSGNIFFTRKLFSRLGGFRNFGGLFVYDFFLRASRIEEPVILTEKTISCRPVFADRYLKVTQSSVDERAEIIQDHLLSLLRSEPENALCNVFDSHSFMFAGTNFSQPLADAFDALVEKRVVTTKQQFEIKAPSGIKNRKKVTLFTHELSLTGAPVIILEMSKLLIDAGYEVEVLSPSNGPLVADFEKNGIKVIILSPVFPRLDFFTSLLSANPKSRLQLIGFLKWSTLLVLRLFRKHFASKELSKLIDDSVLINSVSAWRWVENCLKRKNVRVLWYVHETIDPKWMVDFEADELFRSSIANGSLQMLYGSEATRRRWTSEGYPGKVKYWSGISESLYEGSQFNRIKSGAERRVILNVGSFGSRKGTRVLLDAFALGRQQGIIPCDVELCIVGGKKPSCSQEVRDIVVRANKPDLQGFVRIVGELEPDALNSYYDEASVYVHASFFDCMPIALLTAMARGLPIVATDVDGCGEAIIDEVTGLLVPPRSPQLLAEAMSKLLDDKVMSDRMAQAARIRFVDLFSAESTFDNIKSELDASPSRRDARVGSHEDRRGDPAFA